LEIIWETEPLLNNALMARNNVPKNIVKEVKELIINLHKHSEGQAILARMELTQFENANNSSYQSIVDFIDNFDKKVRSIKFGLWTAVGYRYIREC